MSSGMIRLTVLAGTSPSSINDLILFWQESSIEITLLSGRQHKDVPTHAQCIYDDEWNANNEGTRLIYKIKDLWH